MKVIKIDKKNWAGGIDKSRGKYQIFGSVKDKEHFVFRKLNSEEYPDMGNALSVLSPKSILFPQSEKIITASLDESQDDHHIMKRSYTDYSPRAVIGIMPCDAKAVQLVKLNFETDDYRDPYWCDAYEATTFVGLAVNKPSIYDFTSSMGSGPFAEEGLDVLLVDCEDEYLAKVFTEKGEAFMNSAGLTVEADTNKAVKLIEEMKTQAEKLIDSEKVKTDKLKEKSLLELHGASFWDDLSFACINCGTCTFVCPTCWCFDIQDETKEKTAIRFRNWDTCMSPLFTLHASGHNPRAEKVQRVRQRFMHKLKYFVDKYDKGTMCVGCGRCVLHCPVNIDIREICNTMNSYEAQQV